VDYVLGFIFNETLDRVILIRKNKPEWMKGKLNGIGGKREPGETTLAAMERECLEETGLHITDWRHLGLLYQEDVWGVHVFVAIADVGLSETKEDEVVEVYDVYDVYYMDTVSNLTWLIPLCINSFNDTSIKSFELSYSRE